MNKQEAIKKVNDLIVNACYERPLIDKKDVIDIINQIDEQQKPVIPQFVADYMKYAKSTFCSLKETICFDDIYIYNYANWSRDKVKLIAWMSLEENQEVFAKAWLFGYEIKQEKLYTVEIPDPNGLCNYRYLLKNSKGVTIGTSDNNLWKSWSECKLTEEEIKKDFEWAWEAGFAKPVEE